MKQRKKLPKKRFSKFLLLILGISLFGIVGWGIWQGVKDSSWDGKTRLNLVVASSPVVVASLEPREKTLTLVSIPEVTYLEVPRGFGLYRIGAVFELGHLEGREGRLLAETVEQFLGVPVEGYLRLESRSEKWKVREGDEEQMRMLVRQSLSITTLFSLLRGDPFLKTMETNLSFWDLGRAWWLARQVRFDKIRFYDLEKVGVLEDLVLPDGTVGKTAEAGKLDEVLTGLFIEGQIRKENLTVELLNSTNQPGLAQQASRMIANLGGNVVKIGNQEGEIGKCQIFGPESETVMKLVKIFACEKKSSLLESRAQVVIILGREYLLRLTQN